MKKSANKGEKEFDISEVVGGTLDLFGLKIDLGKLLSAPEEVSGQLEQLREKLKQAGGKEILTDEEWKSGAATVRGQIRTHGIVGEREYHIGTTGAPRPRPRPERAPKPRPPEEVEPPVDVFEEGRQVTIVAEVPGIGLEDVNVGIQKKRLTISTKPAARRAYKKVIELDYEVEPESLQSVCRNGVLEIRLHKKGGDQHSS